MPQPLTWFPTEDGGFSAGWFHGREGYELILEPQLVRAVSADNRDDNDKPWLKWTITWKGEWLSTYWDHFIVNSEYESPLFGLYKAMRAAERFRWVQDYERKKYPRLRRWLRLERLAYSYFKWWLERHYPPARTPGISTRRVRPAERAAAQWERMVEAQAKKRLEQEGREPLRITDY